MVDAAHHAARAAASPKFDNPPVVETAVGIQFAELSGFRTMHFGIFYETIRDRYGFAEDQPRLDPIVETFPKAVRLPHFKVRTAPRPERVWYTESEDGSYLLQLQPDRFGFNWRQTEENARYPSYTESSQLCLKEFRGFLGFCDIHGFNVRPDLCEVIYVNHIWPNEGESPIELFEKIFPGISWNHSDKWLPPPENVRLNRVYVIGDQQGRLYAEAEIAHQKDRGDLILLKMTARVLHRSEDPADIVDTLQLGHDWVVNGFVSLTDPAIRRERWGQTA